MGLFEEYIKCVKNDLLLEKTYDIDDDVDYVYDVLGIDEFLKDYRLNPAPIYRGEAKEYKDSISSDSLKSAIGVKAHERNPITIYFDVYGGNYYNPEYHKINIGVNPNAISYLGYEGLNNTQLVEQEPRVAQEFTEGKIKATIAHELNHWLEDTFRNTKIANSIEKYKSKRDKLFDKMGNSTDFSKISKLDTEFQNASNHEYESYIAGTKQLKRIIGDEEWNKMTFDDYLHKDLAVNQALRSIKANLGDEAYKKFKQSFLKRLDREGLLGDNMKYSS